MASNPVRIMDTTFRDGHQSTLATRMRSEDIYPMAEKIEAIGFEAFEIWGGATFDVMHRFLGEDPWERVIALKKKMPTTPFQMLLRGQNVVGYRNYADDVVEAFCKKAVEVGVDRYRVFDALNDERNFEAAFRALKDAGGHIQGTICFALTERKIGGPVFNMEYFKTKAKTIEEMGADTLCLKDMAGLVSPDDAYRLISELKATVSIPLQFHTHYTSGMASMSYLKAIEAGVDILDCSLSPFALRSSQPAVEPIVVAMEGTDRDTGLDLAKLTEIGQFVESVAPKYRQFLDNSKMSIIDTGVLMHQIPGGMQSNLINQLRQADALDRLHEVHEELPRTRKDLGYPPLVTPTSQIVGVQAVMNVLMGRYEMVSKEVKNYCFGLYGQPPAEIDPEVRKKVLKGFERGETPITGRPGDILEPEMPDATAKVKALLKPAGVNEPELGDVILYALYPRTGETFLKWKHGLTKEKPGEAPVAVETIKEQDELIKMVLRGELTKESLAAVQSASPAAPTEGPRTFTVAVEGEQFSVVVQEGEGGAEVTNVAPVAPRPAPKPIPKPVAAPAPAPAAKPAPAAAVGDGKQILSPMPGTVIKYPVAVGETIEKGQTVVVIEAMKMENALPSPVSGTVKKLGADPGSNVAKGDLLVLVG
jgi:pyruvate carboxylase subunit B